MTERADAVRTEAGRAGEPVRIGGGDAGIEHLLLDAAGITSYPSSSAVVDVPTTAILVFGPSRARSLGRATGVARDHGWLVLSPDQPKGGIVVLERCLLRLLRRLHALDAAPDAVVIRAADVLPGQIGAMREALPAGTTLVITG